PAENDGRVVEGAHIGTIVAREIVHPGFERRATDAQGLARRECALENRKVLEIATAVARRHEADATHLALDVRRSASMSLGADSATLHRIVGKDVEPRHEVSGTDLRRRRLRSMLERQLARRGVLCGREMARANEGNRGDEDDTAPETGNGHELLHRA